MLPIRKAQQPVVTMTFTWDDWATLQGLAENEAVYRLLSNEAHEAEATPAMRARAHEYKGLAEEFAELSEAFRRGIEQS